MTDYKYIPEKDLSTTKPISNVNKHYGVPLVQDFVQTICPGCESHITCTVRDQLKPAAEGPYMNTLKCPQFKLKEETT